jgi:hypothetical protein
MLELVPIFGSVAVFSFLAVAKWSDARCREREAYYKSEVVKKIAEGQAGANAAIEYLREQAKMEERRRRDGLRLGGLITGAVGIGVMVLLRALAQNPSMGIPSGTYLAGLIPLLIGISLLGYSLFMAPKQ